MKIEKQLKEVDSKWELTTIEECLDHTEGQGYWKQGIVLELLKKGEVVFTPFALYRKAE